MRRRTIGVVLVATLAVALGALAPGAAANHWHDWGWRDRHTNYPPRPNGLAAINEVFGPRCTGDVNENAIDWAAYDDSSKFYRVNYHKLLGSDWSSLLGNDVYGHLMQHMTPWIRRGIWGKDCRQIPGSEKWSTHSWGIAVDINSVYDPYGDKQCWTPQQVSDVWIRHGWIHGKSFYDCMHYQWATGY